MADGVRGGVIEPPKITPGITPARFRLRNREVCLCRVRGLVVGWSGGVGVSRVGRAGVSRVGVGGFGVWGLGGVVGDLLLGDGSMVGTGVGRRPRLPYIPSPRWLAAGAVRPQRAGSIKCSAAPDMSGATQFPSARPAEVRGSSRGVRGCWVQATDVAVAQPVVDEREELSCRGERARPVGRAVRRCVGSRP